MKKDLVIEIISAVLILLWVYTGSSKYMEFDRFKFVLGESPVIKSYGVAFAYTIPAVELIIAGLLLIPKTRNIGFWLSSILLLIFTVYLTYMVGFTKDLPCSCGGVIAKMSWTQHIFFNIIMAALAYLGVWLKKHDLPRIFRRNRASFN